MTDEELCGILRGPDAKYFASKAADRIEELAALLKNYRLTFGDIHDVKWNPDASAGLIEAAEQARDLLIGRHNVGSDAYQAFCILNAAISRARAAEREPVTNPGTAVELDELVMLTQEFKGYSLLALMQEAHRLRITRSGK